MGVDETSSGRIRRVLSVFREACRRAPAERRAFLDRECGADAALRAEIEAMLRDDESAPAGAMTGAGLDAGRRVLGELLENGDDPFEPSLPRKVGRYTLVRKLGEGAMGLVYEATQDVPHRQVALKLMRPWALSEETLRRFEHEVEALGRVRHPGIAQVFEGGAFRLEGGAQPFLAMELVDGMDLVAHARAHGLDRDARLVLIALVAEAIQHAHESGVVHRDLKPDNILVSPDGQPKILDFGVARIVEPGVTGLSVTLAGEIVGTLAYMSPEQLLGVPVGPAADVYALGAVAYELLAGETPVAVEGLPLAEAILLVRDTEPRPLGAVDPKLRGEPATIVAKAMEKDPAERYASAGAMAEDIRRFLRHEPIRAHPPSTLYRTRKFVRRHRGLVAGVTAVILLLGTGLVFAAVFWQRERENAARQTRARYRLALSAAVHAIGLHDWARARMHLEDAPATDRGWEWDYVTSVLRSWLVEHVSSAAAVGMPAYAPDGSFVACALDDGTVVLWEPTTARAARILDAGTPLTTLARTLPPGRVVAGTADGRVLVWDLASGARTEIDAGGDGPVQRLDARADATLVAYVRPRSGPIVRVLREGAPARDVKAPRWHVQEPDVVFAPDGSRFAALIRHASTRYGRRAEIAIFATATGERIGGVVPDSEPICLAFSPDGRWIAAGDRQRNVLLIEAATLRAERNLLGHIQPVTSVAFTSDSRSLLSCSREGAYRIWDLATGACRGSVPHAGLEEQVAVHPGGALFSAARPGGRVRTWRLAPAGPRVLVGHSTHAYGVAFSPDGGVVASSDFKDGNHRTCRLWDARSGDPIGVLPYSGHGGWLTFTPDGGRLVQCGDRWGVVRSVDLVNGAVSVCDDGAVEDEDGVPEQRRPWLSCLLKELAGRTGVRAWDTAISRGGTWLARRTDDGIVIRDGAHGPTAARLAARELHGVPDFSPDGRWIACASLSGTVYLWDWQRSTRPRLLDGHTSQAYCVRFHPDGTRLASGSNDKRILLWDLDVFEPVLELLGHTLYVYDLAWSPDGTQLASASGDFTVRLWDALPAAERHTLASADRAVRERVRPLVQRLWAAGTSAEVVLDAVSGPERAAAFRLLMELRWAGNE